MPTLPSAKRAPKKRYNVCWKVKLRAKAVRQLFYASTLFHTAFMLTLCYVLVWDYYVLVNDDPIRNKDINPCSGQQGLKITLRRRYMKKVMISALVAVARLSRRRNLKTVPRQSRRAAMPVKMNLRRWLNAISCKTVLLVGMQIKRSSERQRQSCGSHPTALPVTMPNGSFRLKCVAITPTKPTRLRLIANWAKLPTATRNNFLKRRHGLACRRFFHVQPTLPCALTAWFPCINLSL